MKRVKKMKWLGILLAIFLILEECIIGMLHMPELEAATKITTKEAIKLLGVDVSRYQGNVDWAKVKADGVSFAILRCGYGKDSVSQDDSYWKINADACTKNGIPFGTYIYSYATTEAAAIGEANHALRLVKDYQLQYPIYFDMEDATQKTLSKAQLGKIAKAFCDTIEAAGYEPAIYASYSWFQTYLTDPVFDQYDRWVARYSSSCGYSKAYNMWQFTSTGSVNGISGNVDMNYTIGTEVVANVRSVTISQSQVVLHPGETLQLAAKVYPLNALEKGVKWSSSNKAVATASGGKVVALAAGTTTITVKSKENNAIKAVCEVTVGGDGFGSGEVWQGEVADSPVESASGGAVTQMTFAPVPTDNSGTQNGAETVPTPTSKVKATTKPKATAKATTKPKTTTKPKSTVKPTTKPKATTKPKTTTKPKATTKPKSTVKPTTKPKVTVKPTTKPKPTAKPKATVKPTAKPKSTTKPENKLVTVDHFTYSAVSKKEIKLTWTKVKNASGYYLYYYQPEKKKYVSLATVKGNVSQHTIAKLGKKELQPGTVYKFKIVPYLQKSDGKLALGAATELNTITKPETVQIRKVTRNSANSASVTWKRTKGADGYVIYYAPKRNGIFHAYATVDGKKVNQKMITGLKKGKNYYVWVCAYVKEDGKIWYGNYKSIRTIKKK